MINQEKFQEAVSYKIQCSFLINLFNITETTLPRNSWARPREHWWTQFSGIMHQVSHTSWPEPLWRVLAILPESSGSWSWRLRNKFQHRHLVLRSKVRCVVCDTLPQDSCQWREECHSSLQSSCYIRRWRWPPKVQGVLPWGSQGGSNSLPSKGQFGYSSGKRR